MTEEQRDNILISMSTKLDNLDDKVNKLDDKVNKLDDKVNKMEIRLLKKIDNNTAELIRQRKNIARLEFVLTDKINALFDAREVSLDKFEEHQKNFESINKVLDSHEARIFSLEIAKI